MCVAGGIACAADTGSATGSVSTADSDDGGGGGCLISATDDGSRLIVEMPAVLLIFGFLFIGIEILKKMMESGSWDKPEFRQVGSVT